VDIAREPKNALPGFLMGGVYRGIFGRKRKAGLQYLEEGEPQERSHAHRYSHLGEGEGALG
jgi:hypothetical protein